MHIDLDGGRIAGARNLLGQHALGIDADILDVPAAAGFCEPGAPDTGQGIVDHVKQVDPPIGQPRPADH